MPPMRWLTLSIAALSVGAAAAPTANASIVSSEALHAKATGQAFPDRYLNDGWAAATAYWGKEPECGRHVLVMRPSSGEEGTVHAFANSTICRIWVDLEWARWAPPAYLCGVIVHEVGHLLYPYEHDGFPPDIDPGGVMPQTSFIQIPPQCQHLSLMARDDFFARNGKYPQDRAWCRKHKPKCAAKYPRLYARISGRGPAT